MEICFEKDLPVLVFALVSASTLASLPGVNPSLRGAREGYEEQVLEFRFLLEVILAAIVSLCHLGIQILEYFSFHQSFGLTDDRGPLIYQRDGLCLMPEPSPRVGQLAGPLLFDHLPVALNGLIIDNLVTGGTIFSRLPATCVFTWRRKNIGDYPGHVGAVPDRRVGFRASASRCNHNGYKHEPIRT